MLPPEILLAIRSFIPVSALRDHVCFYNASPRMAALYDSEPDPDLLWRRSCWYCGIGYSSDIDGDPRRTAFWRTLALGLIQRDGFCSHPQCGEALLEYNRQRMQHALGFIPPLSIKQAWSIEELDHEQVGSAHRVLAQIIYPDNASLKASSALDETYAQSLSSPHRHAPWDDTIILADHPLLWRSFASEVPVDKMLLGLGDGMIHTRVPASNPCGVTVLDVVSAIHNKYVLRRVPPRRSTLK
ncbi:hypothetical protein C8Q80DRAFT_157891 [Daedaleopsis nitida]|nr:hypothetical protein C8Q80DRAFT_157891 [Daedaleopsis nitida]